MAVRLATDIDGLSAVSVFFGNVRALQERGPLSTGRRKNAQAGQKWSVFCAHLMSSQQMLTVAEVAAICRVNKAKVYAWINAEDGLAAFDASEKPSTGRPRWKIDPDDLDEFRSRRSSQRRRVAAAPVCDDIIEFYPEE